MLRQMRTAGLALVLAGSGLLAEGHGQTTIVRLTKVASQRTSETEAVITFPTPTAGTIEVRYQGPTGTKGNWSKAAEKFHLDETAAGQTRILVDKLRADLPYLFELRLSTPKGSSDPVGVIVPLPVLLLEDGAIYFRKFKGPYPVKKADSKQSSLELEWQKEDAKKNKSMEVELEVFLVSAAGKFLRDAKKEVISQKFRVTFTLEKNQWSGAMDDLLNALRRANKPEDLKKINLLITLRPTDPAKHDPLQMARFLCDLNGLLLVAPPADFADGGVMTVLYPVKYN